MVSGSAGASKHLLNGEDCFATAEERGVCDEGRFSVG